MSRATVSREPSSEAAAERPDPKGREQLRISPRAAWLLIALCAWTLYVWITRIVIIAGQDNSAGFVVVHVILAVISIAFGLAAGWIGWKALRGRRPGSRARESARRP
jgi:hypothetical protein